MITWGNRSDGKAVLFCMQCRTQFLEPMEPYEANFSRADIAASHYCVPTPPWKPTTTKRNAGVAPS